MDAGWVLGWLGELVEETCPTPPVLVGRTIGGAIAARFAADRPGSLTHLVLVDALGLSAFEPAPRFGLAMQRFLQPTAGSYDRFMDFCAFDLDRLREQWGRRWAPYAAYAVELASTPRVQAAMSDLIGQFAATPIPPAELARITVPTTLIWGRHDLATHSRSPRRSETGTAGRCTSSRTPVTTRPSSNPRRSWTHCAPRSAPRPPTRSARRSRRDRDRDRNRRTRRRPCPHEPGAA